MLTNLLNDSTSTSTSQFPNGPNASHALLPKSSSRPSPSSSRPAPRSRKSGSPLRSPHAITSRPSSSGTATARATSNLQEIISTPSSSPNKAAIDFISNPSGSAVSSRATALRPALPVNANEPLMLGSEIDVDDVEMDEAAAALEGDDVDEGDDDGQEFEDAEEGEGEGDGEDEEEDDEEEEEEEEDDEDDSDDDDDKSEDLEAGDEPEDFEITEVKIAEGQAGDGEVAVKTEPGVSVDGAAPQDGAIEGEQTNILVPKKKKPKKRAASIDDTPLVPPPMKTIRLERMLIPGPDAATVEWNILEDAREKGMVEDWAPVEPVDHVDEKEEKEDGMEVDGLASAPPEAVGLDGLPAPNGAGPRGLFGLGDLDDDPEEIARRLEEKYGDGPKKKPKIKRKTQDAAYDLEDPFIDDSELIIDAPTHFGRAKKEGFYVHAGPLELMEEEIKIKPRTQARKPKTNNPNAPAPRPSLSALTAAKTASHSQGHGTRNSPIAIDGDGDGEPSSSTAAGPSRITRSPTPPETLAPLPIDRALYKNASREPAYLPPFPTFPRGVRHALMELRNASTSHGWNAAEKAKFPETLKPLLKRAGRSTFEYEMFGTREDAKGFYQALTSVLPYNLFTLTKLVQKLCYIDYWNFLQECEETGVEALSELVDKEKDLMIRRYEEAMATWKVEIEDWQAKNPLNTHTPAVIPPTDSQGNDNDTEDPQPSVNGPPREPTKRFTWSPAMREVFTQLLDNHQEILNFNATAAEKSIPNVFSGKEYSERALKQELYKKVVDCFPDGYMSNNDVSKEMSKIRARDKKQQKNVEG